MGDTRDHLEMLLEGARERVPLVGERITIGQQATLAAGVAEYVRSAPATRSASAASG